MNYAELSVAQNQRAKEFSKAQTDAMVAYCNAEHDLMELQAENDKLRKLVLFIMHQCNDGNPRCDECIGLNDGECVALLRMRELGIEVA